MISSFQVTQDFFFFFNYEQKRQTFLISSFEVCHIKVFYGLVL